MSASDRTRNLIVPAYFHPAVRPQDWAALADRAAEVRLVVVNVSDGPGGRPDEVYEQSVKALQGAKVPVAGYVDTAYSRRSLLKCLNEFAHYRDWYRMTGVFFDRVPTGPADLPFYRALSAAVREQGAEVVAFNHGAQPVAGYSAYAELLGVFEGPWSAYVDAGVPRWMRSPGRCEFFHLVHTVPTEHLADALKLAERRNATAYVTRLSGENPFRVLSQARSGPRLAAVRRSAAP